jgi:Flp pilus assembly protein TadG
MEWIMKKPTTFNSRPVCQPRHTKVAPCVPGRDDAGQAILETALLLPFLLLLLIGAIEFGIVAYASIETSNAAAAGALYGAQNHASAVDNAGMIQAARNDASDLTSGIMTVTPSTTCACQLGTTPSAISCASTTSCVTPSRIIQWVRVDTSTTIDPLFHYPGLGTTVTVQGHATMRVQQ